MVNDEVALFKNTLQFKGANFYIGKEMFICLIRDFDSKYQKKVEVQKNVIKFMSSTFL